MSDVLLSVNLQEYTQVFEKEKIDLEMVMDMNTEEIIILMFKDLGINAWGDRMKIKRPFKLSLIKETPQNLLLKKIL